MKRDVVSKGEHDGRCLRRVWFVLNSCKRNDEAGDGAGDDGD